MTLSIIDNINDFIKPLKAWIFKNYSNPLLWIGIVVIVLVIFGIAYSIVHGRDQ